MWWIRQNWWRFFTPVSTKWAYIYSSKITYYYVYIFGIRIVKIQTNDPSI